MMPEHITAPHMDSELQSIRTMVFGKNSQIPFLLLPVRLEARFMKVDQPYLRHGEGLLEEALGRLADLEVTMLGGLPQASDTQAIQQVRTLNQSVQQARQQVEALPLVTRQQKTWLTELATEIQTASQAIGSTMNGQRFAVRIARDQLLTASRQLVAAVHATTAQYDPVFLPARDYMNQLKKTAQKLERIREGKLPYTNPKNKKDLYTYIEKAVAELENIYRPNDDKIAEIRRIKNNQLRRIEELHGQLKQLAVDLPGRIARIHNDAAWQGFASRLQAQLQRVLPDRMRHFDNVILTQLHLVSQMRHIGADVLYYNGLRTLIGLERFNAQDRVQHFTDIRTSRRKLQQQMKALNRMGQHVVDGNPAQLQATRKLWERLDTSFNRYAATLNGFQTAKPSHAFGLQTSLNYVNNNVRPTLRALSQPTPSGPPLLSSYAFRNAQTFFQQSTGDLARLSEAVPGLASRADRVDAFTTELLQLGNRFRIAGRKHLPVAESTYQATKTQIAQLRLRLQRAGLVHDSRIQNELQAIEAGLDAASVIVNQSGLDVRDQPLVTATPTRQVNELWVRIFPDDIHIYTHETALTQDEIAHGQRFWLSWWAASNDAELEIGAWRALVTSYGSQRAAWIARQLDPHQLADNASVLADKPSSPIQLAIDAFKSATELLQDINADMDAQAILDRIDGALLQQRISAIRTQLVRISFEQTPFLQRAYHELRRLQSTLLLIQTPLNAAPAALLAAHASEMAQIQAAFATYEQVQQHFLAIESLPLPHFLARFAEPLHFPTPSLKAQDWSTAPHTRILPDRFVVLTLQGNQYRHVVVGQPIPSRLNVGLDPQKFDFADESDNPFQLDSNGNLLVDDGMRWMIDFEEAVSKGMGLKIPLTQDDAEQGFDRMLVLGLRDEDETTGQGLLEELLDNHHYAPEGMSFLPVGTPTNNTSEGPSGFNSLDGDPQESYRVDMQGPLFAANEDNPLVMADGKRAADALGVNPAVFQHVAQSDGQEVSRAYAMHRALWHVSIGDYMESSWDHIFTYDSIERTYRFFTDNVVGRGILPTLRVGTQPYGILPTTAFSRLRFHPTFDEDNLPPLNQTESNLQLRYTLQLKRFLLKVKSIWESLAQSKVKHAYNLPVNGDEGDLNTLPTPQQHFMEMLGLQASSIDSFFRYGINVAYRGPDPEDLGFTVGFTNNDPYSAHALRTLFDELMRTSNFSDSFAFPDEQNPSPDAELQRNRQAGRILLQFVQSHIFASRYLDKHTQISGPIIDTQALSDVNTVEKNITVGSQQMSYIEWLIQGADHLYDLLGRNDFTILPSNAMLFMLLRQSLLLAYREAALNVMQDEGFFTESYRRLIGGSDRFRLYHPTLDKYVYTSKWTFLFRDLKTFNGLEGIDFSGEPLFAHLGGGERSLADFLLNKSNLFHTYNPSRRLQLQPYRDRVDEIRDAMAVLDTIPTRALDRLLAEHVDVSSYRLDAWLLGLANRRLQVQRNNGAHKGIYLGAYGWLEDLRPGGQRNEAVNLPVELQAAEQSPVYTDADNEGFIHAPSLNQAITAAVLRSGYTASRESIGDLDNQMAVNLSSRRVRMGLSLIEGVNNGQPLGAILGFQFERGLHESYTIVELDRFIYRFREQFPLTVPIEVTTEQTENSPQTQVVDGYALLQAIDAHIDALSGSNTDQSIFEILTASNFANCPAFITTIVDDHLQSGDNRTLILQAIIREIDRIGDALDALGDLVISESVYQVVQGNHVRAAAVVEALAAGKAPAELQFINTPRTGVVVTHRAVLHVERIAAHAASAPTGWPSTLTPRAKAEPSLNRWLGEVLGPASQILCLAYNDTQAPHTPIEIALSALGMQPIDLVYILGFNAEQGGSELEGRLVWHVRDHHAFDPEDVLRVNFTDRQPAWTREQKTIYELTPLILPLKELLTEVKYVDALDISIPDDEPELDNPERLFSQDLQDRVEAAETALRQVATAAQTLIDTDFANTILEAASFTTTQLDSLRGFLFDLAAYGLPGSVPTYVADPRVGENVNTVGRELLKRLLEVLKTVGRRLQAYAAQQAKLADATQPRQIVDLLINMGRQLFGSAMVFLPHYEPKNKAAIAQQLNLPASDNLLRHRTDHHVLNDWLQELSNLRPGLYALDMGRMLAHAFGNPFPDFQPVQFPYAADDYWLGLEYPAEFAPEGDYLSLLLINSQVFSGSDTRLVGLIMDEWTEIIPQRQEVTGLAFHYDQPDAQAPQNLLLVVSPDVASNWSWDNLVHTLHETLDLAKIRAVEPDHIDDSLFAQVLPAIVSEVAPPQVREYDEDDGADDKPYRNPLGTQVIMDFADNLPKKET
jgi:hypothetical protein